MGFDFRGAMEATGFEWKKTKHGAIYNGIRPI
jgi:hypothetical protein